MKANKPFSQQNAIRIVPLYKLEPEQDVLKEKHVAKKKPAQFSYGGGPLLANVEVFTVFWGAGWQDALKDTATKINQFFEKILKSSLINQLAEYSTSDYSIGKGTLTGTITITENAPVKSITDAEIQTQLLNWIDKNNAFSKPNGNTLYFIYFDNGISVSLDEISSCSSFCGYHNNANDKTFYAVVPYPSCIGCKGSMQVFDAITSTSSHELCEAITDSIPGNGWYNDQYGEIGDICVEKFKTLEGYNVQLEWSNKKNKCV